MESSNSRPQSDLYFDPSQHPDDTLKAFDEFTKMFELRYSAQFPDPPKVSLDAALNRWKIANATADQPDPKPSLDQYDEVVATWQAKDKVAKLLGMFSSSQFVSDWQAAQPDANRRAGAEWTGFLKSMRDYYKPTENMPLKNYQFRYFVQGEAEPFSVFCGRLEKEANHCNFKCIHADCTAQSIAIRDQIIFGMSDNRILP